MRIPMNAFERKPEPRWGIENPYNSRALVHNWYEDRRQYHLDCSRCTGRSIYKTDYLANRLNDYEKTLCLPPKEFEARRRAEGDGPMLLMNTEDYCPYLRNYTTTYDLMHNWEVRRAGVKPKPWRKWKLVADALWIPQPDNALSFGNLTQFGYRQAPQLPMVPNDWQTYSMGTTYKQSFVQPKYPNEYVLCRTAAPKCIRKEVDDMALTKKIGSCEDCAYFWHPKNPKDNDATRFPCGQHAFIPNVPRVHPTLIPGHTLHHKDPCQTLFPASARNLDQLKRVSHPKPIPGEPILESVCPGPCDTKDICNEVAAEMNNECALAVSAELRG